MPKPYLIKKGILYELKDALELLMDYRVFSSEKNIDPRYPMRPNFLS